MARRDDRGVAQALSSRKKVDAIRSLTSAGSLDAVFVFVKHIGFTDALQSFSILGYKRRQPSLSPRGEAPKAVLPRPRPMCSDGSPYKRAKRC